MIDLLRFYKDRCNDGYYRKFYGLFSKLQDGYFFEDNQEIIDRFRDICKPPEKEYEANNNLFLLLCFWLYKNGFSISEFPNLLSRPKTLHDFAYIKIRAYLGRLDDYPNGVPWKERRNLCDNLTITRNSSFQDIPNELEEKIRLISIRDADFDSMEIDERLQLLNNLLENLLKQDGKFIDPNYDQIFFGYFTKDTIKDYRSKTHCFRHGGDESLKEREKFSKEEKEFLCDLGIFMAIYIHKYLNK